jgi:DNA-binding LacI/PurR family transcriptional regulator
MTTKRKGKVTIGDVAQKAGVSVGTASQALNNKQGIAAKTIEKVLSAARELNYYPSDKVRHLRIISLYLVTLDEGKINQSLWDFYFSIIQGFTDVLKEHDFRLHLESISIEELTDLPLLLDLMHGNYSNGAAFVIPLQDDYEERIKLNKIPVPMVTLFSNIDDSISSVNIDNFNASLNVVNWLKHIGHEHIVFVSGPENDHTALERKKGYLSAMKGSSTCSVYYGNWTHESGVSALKEIITSGQKVTAIFCANDFMAMGVMRACKDLRIRIPDDISLVGFDDSLMCQFSEPQLTSVRMPLYQMGRKGAELLFRKHQIVKHPFHTILPAELVIRNSVIALQKVEQKK